MRRCLLLAIVVPCLLEACSRSADSPPDLLINEVMARNREFPFTDPGGHHLDWVEVYNPNPTALSLGGYTLTDNPKRPRKYRFPASETIPAGGHTVVWLVSGADEEAGEAEAVEFTSLHADFGISRREDRLLLYAQDGERVVDQVSFKNLATDTSMGRYPDGSATFGTMFAPSPGEANHPIGVEPIRWESLPRAGRAPDGEPVPVRFTLLQDVEAGGASAPLPTVRVEFVEQDDCSPEALEMLLDAAPSGFVEVSVELESEAEDLEPCTPDIDPDDPERVDPDDGCRRDVDGEVIEAVRVRRLSYVAFLPSLPDGRRIVFRVIADDSMRVLEHARCYEFGFSPTLVVSEYQPRNQETLLFVCATCPDTCCAPCQDDACMLCGGSCGDDDEPCETCLGNRILRSPDWIEIYNYGEESIDLTDYCLTGRRDVRSGNDDEQNLCTWTFGEDTFDDPFMTTIGPGEYRIVLADDDGGERRIYHRVVDDGTGRLVVDTSRKFYSTRFRLQADRRRPDEFQLVADRVISIDLVRLDFSFFAEENGFDVTADNFLVDFSVGRFPDEEDEPYAPDALEPGIVTPCPTPGGPNSLVCDIDAPPTFDDVVSVFPRCPREDEPARVRTRVSIDSDAGDEFDLELIYRVDGGADVTLSRGDGVTVTLAPQGDQFDAVRGATLYEVEATVPPQPAGARVEFRLRAFDRFLDVETILGEENAPRLPGEEPRVSFTYLSGFTPDPVRVRINEVLPFNRATSVPPAPPATDFVELFLPADASAEYDLSGHFLAVERLSEEEGAPIRFPREWRFPDETRIRPGEHLVVFVEDLPEETPGYPQVDTFDLDDCRSTIYLVGPTETLANCILDSLSWRLACVEGGEPDRSVGRVCDGSEDFDFRRLHRPTPGTTNVELPFLHGVAHVPLLGGDVNECPAPGSQVELRVLFFVDRLLPDLFGNSEAIAGATIEMENGASFDIPAARISSRPRLPQNFLELYKPTIPPRCGRDEDRANSCFKAYRFFQFVPVPDEPIVRFRFTVTDACGNVLGPCREDEFCFEFATTLQDRPRSVRINEINRFFPLPGDVRQRPWIELYNDSEEEVDLSGMFLSNDPDLPRLAEIPPGTTIAAGGTLLLVTDGLPLPDDRLADEVIDLDWAQFESNDARRCRADGTLFLVDREDRGSCLLDSFPFCFSLTPEFCDPDTSCDGRSLGRLPDGAGRIALLPEPSPGAPNRAKTPEVFLRGDTDKDGRHNITDAVIILRHLFFGRAADCLDALDADDTGTLNITDAIFLLSYLFDSGAPAPPAPFDAPGADPTPDNLDCAVGLRSP